MRIQKTKCFILIIIFVFFSVSYVSSQKARWFNDEFIRSIVLLEKKEKGNYTPHGTGFLIYNYEKESNPIVVTCAHLLNSKEIYITVLADSELISLAQEKKQEKIQINECIWELEGNKLRCKINLKKDITFITHPDENIDVAAIPINLGTRIVGHPIYGTVELTKTTMISHSSILIKSDALLGDEVYFVGFPFGIGTTGDFLPPLVRSGSIAWFSEQNKIFLLDAFSYPGNSGSPIFSKITIARQKSYLIGMVVGHIGQTIEYSKGIGCTKSKLSIDQNFGLARCVCSDDILKVVKVTEKLQK